MPTPMPASKPAAKPPAPPAAESSFAESSAPTAANPQLQQILSTLPPEKQDLVKQVMVDADVLRAIDQITELLAPEVAAKQGPSSLSQSPDEMMFGPRGM